MKSFSSRLTSGRGVARRLFACEDGRRLYAPVAAARPRDRHTRASLGVVDLEARPGPPDPPAPFTPVAPVCWWLVRRVFRPGPAAAHRHRSQALRPLRRPPHRRRLCRCALLARSPLTP